MQEAIFAAGDCQPGSLMCKDPDTFGICDASKLIQWRPVADGTTCQCGGDECEIVAVGNQPNPTATVASWQAPSAVPVVSAVVKPPLTQISDKLTTQTAYATGTPDDGYKKVFLGQGTREEGWPTMDEWLSFDSIWAADLRNVISTSCRNLAQANPKPENSPSESDNMRLAVRDVAALSKVDERFILAILMQESNGCVRVQTTNNGVENPGLMQSHDGTHSCANAAPQECSLEQIRGMIEDGVMGTASGDGLQQILGRYGTDAVAYYRTARVYNSGSYSSGAPLQSGGGSTNCYVSDIANRLIGWSSGVSGCRL